jgi:LEA14-like dessication related protein
MFFTRRRIILIFAVAAVAGTIIILPYISSLTATGLDRVTIELLDVELAPVSQEQDQIDVVFRLTNPTDKTVTTSKIEYDLIADNTELGNSILSYEDVPPNGRPTILPHRSINLTSPFQLPTSQPTQIIFSKLTNSSSDIDWKVEGVARIESAVTLHEKPFTDEL